MDVKQAAEALGISSEGIRQRIRRGSLESEKDTDGRVYVYLDEGDLDGAPSEHSTDVVMTRLKSEVEFLRKELATRDAEIQRRDAVLLSLSEGLKALNPPASEARESPQTPSEEYYGTSPQEAEDSLQRRSERQGSWWRRFFGLE